MRLRHKKGVSPLLKRYVSCTFSCIFACFYVNVTSETAVFPRVFADFADVELEEHRLHA